MILIGAIILLSGICSAACDLDLSLISQEPYPATPGDYVKVVFQMQGIVDTTCGNILFEITENYPFSLDAGEENQKSISPGEFISGYDNSWTLPYRIRIDENAIDGENELEVIYSSEAASMKKKFNITIEDSRSDFEIHVKTYDFETEKITFGILNTGEKEIYAFTLEIPDQETIKIVGTNREVVGDIESNEEEITSFYLKLSEEEQTEIGLKLIYTDDIGVRRVIDKTVSFNPEYFLEVPNGKEEEGFPTWAFLLGIVVAVIACYFYLRWKKKKKFETKQNHKDHYKNLKMK